MLNFLSVVVLYNLKISHKGDKIIFIVKR